MKAKIPDGLEVPPNCLNFNAHLFEIESDDHTPICVCHAEKAWREVVACVAAQYWRFESEKEWRIFEKTEGKMAADAHTAAVKADLQESAWLVWGFPEKYA